MCEEISKAVVEQYKNCIINNDYDAIGKINKLIYSFDISMALEILKMGIDNGAQIEPLFGFLVDKLDSVKQFIEKASTIMDIPTIQKLIADYSYRRDITSKLSFYNFDRIYPNVVISQELLERFIETRDLKRINMLMSLDEEKFKQIFSIRYKVWGFNIDNVKIVETFIKHGLLKLSEIRDIEFLYFMLDFQTSLSDDMSSNASSKWNLRKTILKYVLDDGLLLPRELFKLVYNYCTVYDINFQL